MNFTYYHNYYGNNYCIHGNCNFDKQANIPRNFSQIQYSMLYNTSFLENGHSGNKEMTWKQVPQFITPNDMITMKTTDNTRNAANSTTSSPIPGTSDDIACTHKHGCVRLWWALNYCMVFCSPRVAKRVDYCLHPWSFCLGNTLTV